ncbi:ankycorbin isoform X1 [Cololabis saira]|uniref:ankycorbin isoform X1 n=1 Tax=Cololabis saira TaxID=129043 RepID=UPI002AD36CB4|nr:ankycorbin isoform X1 [Cololabis saira]XP_061590262.1 ankycorbin isoform X1 [Cololabis saira]
MKSLKAKFRKTDVNEWNKNDERLLAAVEHGEVEKVATLLAKKGANAVKLDNEGKSALHVAAARGQTECLAVILAHGADLSVTDAAGFPALHLASKNCHVECCRKLIQNKCPIDAVDSSGKTALHHAAASGNLQIVQLQCELKSPINLKDADGVTSLLLSAKHNHPEVCSALLDCGAEINTSDNTGRTALMVATESSAVSVVEVLVQRGADLSAVDSEGHDALHYSKLLANSEAKTAITTALNRLMYTPHREKDAKSPKSPQHDQLARLSDERITTPKKRKAPPPPISPLQSSGPSSPSVMSTPASNKSDTSMRFNYKEDDIRESAMREEVEKLHEERSMLLETIEDLRQTVETVTGPELDTKVEQTASAALVSALQARITALTSENQQLSNKLKKHPSIQGNEEMKENSRPNSMNSNSSFHSTQDDFYTPPQVSSTTHVEGREHPGVCSVKLADEGSEGGSQEEIILLRQALESVQIKLVETRNENRALQAQVRPERGGEREEDGGVREKGREEELMESLAELQAKLTDTQERYHHAMEEVEDLRAQMGGGGGGGGGELTEKQEAVRCTSSTFEQEVRQLKAQLIQSESEQDKASQQIRQLEEALKKTQEERQMGKEKEQRTAQTEELYKEAKEEVRMLQEALRGTVPVEAAAKDFEEMKAELNEVIAGLQRRLLELSHSYSETKSQLSATQKALSEARAECSTSSSPSSEQVRMLEETQALLADAQLKYSAAQEEILTLKQEAEAQAQSTVALSDHAQVMSTLGNAIKELEGELESLKEQLHQKTIQVEDLQNRLNTENNISPADSVSRLEHDNMREQLEGEVNHLTQLLQGALRKQDEMALEAADAWQKARDNRAEREALQELLMSKEKENQTLTSKLAESQDAVCQLKQLVENHVASEREKNKRIDDLSREVGKLKDALNSLSQLSYSSCSPLKRQQQNQQLETLQQQIKQLQHQIAESKKQHNEIVSVYRMHLLYAVQGQMDEDVQKALKQILLMCKMPSQAKEAC